MRKEKKKKRKRRGRRLRLGLRLGLDWDGDGDGDGEGEDEVEKLSLPRSFPKKVLLQLAVSYIVIQKMFWQAAMQILNVPCKHACVCVSVVNSS